jgi:hypothetical protein
VINEEMNYVTTFFADDQATNGALLVGSEGIHSAVRTQHIPRWSIVDTGIRILYGKSSITSEF